MGVAEVAGALLLPRLAGEVGSGVAKVAGAWIALASNDLKTPLLDPPPPGGGGWVGVTEVAGALLLPRLAGEVGWGVAEVAGAWIDASSRRD